MELSLCDVHTSNAFVVSRGENKYEMCQNLSYELSLENSFYCSET